MSRIESGLALICDSMSLMLETDELKWKFFVSTSSHPVATVKALRARDEDERRKYWEQVFAPPTLPPVVNQVIEAISKEFTLANGISAARPLLMVAANLAGLDNPLEYSGLVAAAFSTDALDGWAARKFGKSPKGDFVDILADGTTSGLMYIHLASASVIPQWVPVVTIGRDIATNIIRATHMILEKDLTERGGVLGIGDQKLVSSRLTRTGYGSLKAAVGLSAPFVPPVTEILSEVATAACLVRGVPVIFNKSNKELVSALKKAVRSDGK